MITTYKMTNIYLDDNQDEQDLSEDLIDTDEAQEEVIDEAKQKQINYNNWVQKLLKKQKAMDFAVDNLSEVSEDPAHLLIVAEKNRESASYILKKYYGWISLEEFKKQYIKWGEEPQKNDEDVMRKKIEQEIEQRDINKYIKEFKKNIAHHDEEIQEKIISEYEDYIEGKSWLDVDKAKKYMHRAYQDIIGAKYDDTKNVASMMWVWGWKATSKTSSKDDSMNSFRDFMGKTVWRNFA